MEAEQAAATMAQRQESSQPSEPTALDAPPQLEQPATLSTAPQEARAESPNPPLASNRERAAEGPLDSGGTAPPAAPTPLWQGEHDASGEEGVAAAARPSGAAALEQPSEAPTSAALSSEKPASEGTRQGSATGEEEEDRADAVVAAASEPSQQPSRAAATEPPPGSAEATSTARATAEETDTALTSQGSETAASAVITPFEPTGGQQPSSGTTPEGSPAFHQDVSL